MKKILSIISVFLVFSMLTTQYAFAIEETIDEVIEVPSEKISDALSAQFDLSSDGEKLPALIWLTDVDLSSTEEAALAAINMTKEEFESCATTSTYSTSRTALARQNDIIQTYIEAKRAAAEQLYLAYNQTLAQTICDNVEILYISKYSPVILVSLSENSALSLAAEADVDKITYYGNAVEGLDTDLTRNAANSLALSQALSIIRADEAHTSSYYGFTGDGVKVGVLELSLPTVSRFPDLNIAGTVECYDETYDEDHSWHANNVLEVISSIAPDAEYYLAASNTASTTMTAIESLMRYGVNIITASRTIGGGGAAYYCQYGDVEQWLDHIAYQHDVHFVKSCGNKGPGDTAGEEAGPNSGAMAYNIITVGNLYANGTTALSDDLIWTDTDDGSSYYTGNTLAFKPDICAPGQGVYTRFGSFGGTSCATPQVAGAIALMCEQRPDLKYLQNTVKAILTASVNFSSPHGYTPSDANYRMYGAGLLDCIGACYVVGGYRYITDTFPASTTSKTHTFTVTGDDTRMRIALAFHKKSKDTTSESDSDHLDITTGDALDLNIYIRDPSGCIVGSSITTKNNVEIVDFVPTVTGTYTIIVNREDFSSETAYYGIAWR